MNREVLFRGKCVSDSKYAGEWVTGGYVAPDADCKRRNEGLIVEYFGGNTTITYHVDPDTVGQSTGLVDKNGVKIFEGDIVKRVSVNSDSSLYYDCGVVVFDNGNASFKLSMYKCVFNGRDIGLFDDDDDATCNFVTNVVYDGQTPQEDEYCYEVISNIHDNSELLAAK